MDDEIDEIEKIYNYKFHDRNMVKFFQEIISKTKDENMLVISVDWNFIRLTSPRHGRLGIVSYGQKYGEYGCNYEQRKNYTTDMSVLASFNDIILWMRAVEQHFCNFIIEYTFNIKILLCRFKHQYEVIKTIFDNVMPIFINVTIKTLIIYGDYLEMTDEYLLDLPFSIIIIDKNNLPRFE